MRGDLVVDGKSSLCSEEFDHFLKAGQGRRKLRKNVSLTMTSLLRHEISSFLTQQHCVRGKEMKKIFPEFLRLVEFERVSAPPVRSYYPGGI